MCWRVKAVGLSKARGVRCMHRVLIESGACLGCSPGKAGLLEICKRPPSGAGLGGGQGADVTYFFPFFLLFLTLPLLQMPGALYEENTNPS